MNNQFTLHIGRWKLVKKDGSSEEVESDGTMIVDVTQYAYVFAQLPKQP